MPALGVGSDTQITFNNTRASRDLRALLTDEKLIDMGYTLDPTNSNRWLKTGESQTWYNADGTTRPVDGTSTTTAGAGPTAGGQAGASIRNLLHSYGLDELVPLVDNWVRSGLSWDEIEVQLRDRSTPAGQIVDRLFPEIRMLQESKQQPMSIAQIQQYRTTARQMYRAAGLPTGFYDEDSDFTTLIVGSGGKPGVSLAELQDRIDNAWNAVQNAPKEVRSELERWYGISTDQEVAMLLLDPNRDAESVKRITRSAAAAGGFAGSRFGSVSQQEAERLASLGVGFGEARQGAGVLDRTRELAAPIVGERGGITFSREQQFGAVFEGDSRTVEQMETQGARRAAAFRGGGGVATSREGYAGLGSASR